MKLHLPKPGTYVVAVSGGIDSVCLLDILLSSGIDYRLVVAHFDHGIRPDSRSDKQFVHDLAKVKGLDFYSKEGKLGPSISEADARKARYDFLHEVRTKTGAEALITAHHQDDRLETLIINLIRGTGRKGMSSLKETELIKRPLLQVGKQELRDYAAQQNLSWREDSTNHDDRYLRNYVRLNILPQISGEDRLKLLNLMDRQLLVNQEIDTSIDKLFLKGQSDRLLRQTINLLPYLESKELIAAWLRVNNLVNFDHKTIERLTLAAKTKRPGTKVDVINRTQMTIDKEYLALSTIGR